MREEVVKIYNFDELKKDVQEAVVEKYKAKSEWCWDYADSSSLTEIFKDKLGVIGLPTDDINWRLCHCQGDGVAFYGDVDLVAWYEYYVQSEETYFSNEEVGALKNLIDYLEIKVIRIPMSYHYSHSKTMSISIDSFDGIDDYLTEDNFEETVGKIEEYFTKKVEDVSCDLESLGYEIIDSHYEDKYIIDVLTNNEYEFLEDGEEW